MEAMGEWCTAPGALTAKAEMTEVPGAWGCVFKQEVDEDNVSDTTSQSLESLEPIESHSSNSDETEASEIVSEPRRLRATLTKDQAAVIYVLRPPQKDNPYPRHVAAGNSQLLSKWFGVSPKAVRDVWNRRTWAHATGKHVPASVLDALPMMMEQQEKARSARRPRMVKPDGVVVRPPGRPIGSKDMKPRRRRVAMKVADNFMLDTRVPQNCMQPGMSSDAVHAAMFNANLIPPIELMEERGGSQSEPPGFSDGSSRSPPSPSPSEGGDGGDALDYLSGARWHPTSGGSASAASMAASAHAQQAAAAAWNMYEVPSPARDDLQQEGGGSPYGRNFPFFLSPAEAAAAEVAAQQHHRHQQQQYQLQQQQHRVQQQRADEHAHSGGASQPPSRDGFHPDQGGSRGIEAWRGGSGVEGGEAAQWEQWARYAMWQRNDRSGPPQSMPGSQWGMGGAPARAGVPAQHAGSYPGYSGGLGGGAYGQAFGAW